MKEIKRGNILKNDVFSTFQCLWAPEPFSFTLEVHPSFINTFFFQKKIESFDKLASKHTHQSPLLFSKQGNVQKNKYTNLALSQLAIFHFNFIARTT